MAQFWLVCLRICGADQRQPQWLVNPATPPAETGLLLPGCGIAVRIAGLTAKGQPRQSDWDALEETSATR